MNAERWRREFFGFVPEELTGMPPVTFLPFRKAVREALDFQPPRWDSQLPPTKVAQDLYRDVIQELRLPGELGLYSALGTVLWRYYHVEAFFRLQQKDQNQRKVFARFVTVRVTTRSQASERRHLEDLRLRKYYLADTFILPAILEDQEYRGYVVGEIISKFQLGYSRPAVVFDPLAHATR